MTGFLAIALILCCASSAIGQPAATAREVVTAFKALHSALDIGVNYDDYTRRLIDTKIRYDRYYEGKNATASDARVRLSIQAAMHYHRLAQSAWTTKIRTGEVRLFNFDSHKNDQCQHLRPLMADIERNWPDTDDRNVMVAEPWGPQLIPALWSCAAEKLAGAERLLGGAK